MILTLVIALLFQDVTVGSKKFTEGVILGDVVTLVAQAEGLPAEHRREIGGTRVLWSALLAGEIDAYPEYTGTLMAEILSGYDGSIPDTLRRLGIGMSPRLGFNNTYVIGLPRALAEERGITTTSDLRAHPDLILGFTNEFMDRADGWPLLRTRYRLPQTNVRGLDHDLAYQGVAAGDIQVIDLYSTDAEIAAYDLVTLEDDLGVFPEYQAMVLYRLDAPAALQEALERLAGAISEATMVAMNAAVRLEGESEGQVAADFLRAMGIEADFQAESRQQRIARTTVEHLILVGISLAAAILLAIPLGIWAARGRVAGAVILGTVGVIYTIPSLALLVFMIPLLGIGGTPAIVALFLYSLLPIVRNTHAGLTGIPAPLRESAAALGLGTWRTLRKIELPLAMPSILAGIKTAAVINVGTATLGAIIGAGGYGQPILTGIRLDDTALILEGAVPAAVLALAAQGLFDLLERFLVPRGLRLKPA
ncbi:MAG: ABC transporter permease subunit [Rhodothermales bacterium]|nr:ABC transporter permease subunit [Rhodothermales bacterium]MBO6779392.1 ABC transporter permease subunit [Rhodothermales bacterium]